MFPDDGQQAGLGTGLEPPMYVFFSFFFLTNVNFELNRLCHSHLTPPPATPQHVDHINARWHYTVQGPGWGLTLYAYISIKIHSNQNHSGESP